MKSIKFVLVFCVSIFIANCGTERISETGGPPVVPDPERSLSYSLSRYRSGDELASDLRSQAILDFEEELRYYSTCNWTYSYDYADSDQTSSTAPESASSDDVAAGFTETNIQEAGVDEGDIIKTDGQYIYTATTDGVDIFKAWPIDQFEKIGEYSLGETPLSLYLDGGKLVLISSSYSAALETGNITKITVLDITDPSSPVLVETKVLEGYFISSRLAEHILHLVFSTYIRRPDDGSILDGFFTQWDRICQGNENTSRKNSGLATLIEETKAEYSELLASKTLEDWLPRHGDGQNLSPADWSDFVKDDSTTSISFTGILSLDLDSNSENMTFVGGYSYEIYASRRSIYLAATGSSYNATAIHRFATGRDHGLHEYFGSTSVAGYINNSFSMGEFDNTFRIATTEGFASSNSIHVLDNTQPDLPVIGSVENIAPGERIYATRFIGNMAYLVTFRVIDPLFVIDLSDPAHPVVAGELEMPGFSSYLHPLDENHLIGLGMGSNNTSNFWFDGIKLAIFDVGNPSSPAIVDDLIIGNGYSSSPAIYDHHAFTYDERTGILALPVTLFQQNYYYQLLYHGVQIYSISPNAGITTLAQIELDSDECESGPLRTIIIGEEDAGLYVLDSNELVLVSMDNYSILERQPVGEISDSSNSYYCWEEY